jgi:hypothetical protein
MSVLECAGVDVAQREIGGTGCVIVIDASRELGNGAVGVVLAVDVICHRRRLPLHTGCGRLGLLVFAGIVDADAQVSQASIGIIGLEIEDARQGLIVSLSCHCPAQ